ncbi:DUF6779 domain-containing protein [Gordonia sp. NB41Y]|uniref:DUF6779 domain-containing protein n=1 Tax=Gordonia sp. NB41Y TaxID=875808 RepID=UPI0006B1D0B3|nr:DUF6779 domain-containing protein [Gordonia sp. NB41Y]EMP11307.2 hypothetical protein ISGA_5752 [Gordonia sp. NB41Y]WLP89204.1 hypothetical protein Q9K23_16575 [Gordonia sp. NB41Y]
MTTSSGRSSDARRTGRSVGQWLLGLLILLAVVASVLMVVTDSLSVTGTLAVIAALWAAVIGAILVTRFRKQAESAEAKSRDLRLVYELQLEREIAARRQYELDVEATIRKEVAAESGAELVALKEQVISLRSSLERLLGEALPDDQVALPNEKLRELASGIGSSGLEPERFGSPAGFGVHDDDLLAARDFAATAPTADDGRHLQGHVDPNEMTEVIPVVTDDPLSGRIATEVPLPADEPSYPSYAPYVSADDTEDATVVEEAQADAAPAEVSAVDATGADDTPTDEWPPSQPIPVIHGRHEGAADVEAPEAPHAAETPQDDSGAGDAGGRRRRRDADAPGVIVTEAPAETPEDDPDAAHSNGLPVAELLKQLREADSSGGRRRRRD